MEFPIRNLIFDTVEKRSADAGSLPPGFWLVFSVFQAVHRTWFWYRRSKEVWRRENCFELALAIGMRLVVGDSASLRLVAKIVEVTLHTAKCIDDIKRIKKTGTQIDDYLPYGFRNRGQDRLGQGGLPPVLFPFSTTFTWKRRASFGSSARAAPPMRSTISFVIFSF